MGKTPDATRMDEWQRQWENMRQDGKSPEEFWKNQWLNWHKAKNVESNPGSSSVMTNHHDKNETHEKVEEQFHKRSEDEKSKDFEKEFWQHVWDYHKDESEWKEPGHFMGRRVHEQWEKMMDDGKTPEEFWNIMWQEMKENRPDYEQKRCAGRFLHGPPWMNPKLQEKWHEMEKNGKSPADFWKTVKEDMHDAGDEKPSIFRRFFEKRLNKKMDEFIQEGKMPDEIWKKWEEKHSKRMQKWFGSHEQSKNYGDDWKPWMFHYGDNGIAGRPDFRWRHGFGRRHCPMSRGQFVPKEYDERAIFKEFDF